MSVSRTNLSSACGASFHYTPVSWQARLPRAPPTPVLYGAADLSPQLALQGANLSDSLMDRAVIVGANLKNANLTRAVFTRWRAIYLGTSCLLVSCSTCVRACLAPVSSSCHLTLMSDTACRSDFKDANIEGADFTNALVDRTQQIVSSPLYR